MKTCNTSTRLPVWLCCSSLDPSGIGIARNERIKDFFPEANKGFWRSGWSYFLEHAVLWTNLFQGLPAVHLLTGRLAHPEAVNRRPVGSSFIMGVALAAHFPLCLVYRFFFFFFWLDQTCLIKQKWAKPRAKKSTSDSGKWDLVCARCLGSCLLANAY